MWAIPLQSLHCKLTYIHIRLVLLNNNICCIQHVEIFVMHDALIHNRLEFQKKSAFPATVQSPSVNVTTIAKHQIYFEIQGYCVTNDHDSVS